MGIVYLALHINLKREAAVKILHSQLVAERRIVDRFYQEMEAFGKLRDPHIVHAYDAGQWKQIHFLAMEYVDGAASVARRAELKRNSQGRADGAGIAGQSHAGRRRLEPDRAVLGHELRTAVARAARS